MDRLIVLVALRIRLEWRGLTGSPGRAIGLAIGVPGILFGATVTALLAYFGIRLLEARLSELLVPALSAVATGVALLWVLAPLIAGVALAETYDLRRLVHFPVPPATLVASSLVANLFQPTVVVQLIPIAAVAAALAGEPLSFGACLAGVALTFFSILTAAQAVGLALVGVARNRRHQDLALFVGLSLSFALSLLPLMFILGGWGGGMRVILERDLFALSPFAWGVRAAAHAGRGAWGPFAAWIVAAIGALTGGVGLCAALATRAYRGELLFDTGSASGSSARARIVLPGVVGALVEKDLRVAWRDPRLKAMLFTGLFGPLVLLLLFWGGSRGGITPGVLLFFASITGLGTFGANAFALERRGIGLLFGFPVPRHRILVAKNLAAIVLRLPGVVALLVLTVALGGLALLPAVAVIAGVTLLLAAGTDNFMAILFPIPVPGPEGDPLAPVSGGRGLAAAALGAALLVAAMAVSGPFAFLAWLPYLLEAPALWLLTLPLALVGAVAAYAVLCVGAAQLLVRREPELLARVLAEE